MILANLKYNSSMFLPAEKRDPIKTKKTTSMTTRMKTRTAGKRRKIIVNTGSK